MKEKTQYDVNELLSWIDPGALDYQEWLNVGMALKDAGYPCSVWDEWSKTDPKSYTGDTFRKWDSFHGNGKPVTMGTIVQMAKDFGWQPPQAGYEIGWDDEIHNDVEHVVVRPGWVELQEVREPKEWNPAQQLITYLDTLFGDDEYVGYVTEVWEKDDRIMPTKGAYDRTAGELKAQLRKYKDDIGAVIGDANPEAGAWIRFNPLDGKGIKNENVIEYRYALVESDETEIDQQNAILRELELPIAALVHSGKKSLHAIVRIDAPDYDEYRRRVEYLYDVCRKNGLKPDKQNKNPSRLSRMPGIMRNGHKQFLIDTNIGKASWGEWKDWIESVNDDLPDPEPLADWWYHLPELSAPLIDGILRKGHKMLLAGPSKAGKSFALIELCIAIAEGRRWMGFPCAQGRVLYVNLELDRASCLHRFHDVYEALNWTPRNIGNIDIWNLRGNSIPMNKLTPKLIRRAQKKDYAAVVIDPIYKVLTGDENSADQMAMFCNQFDKVCHELGAAVIYCHHHSKGYQGSKRSMDRASGSGVFARDPDALLDLTELEVSADTAKGRTAWRIEGTLREFPRFAPVNVWFDYPIHKHDENGTLASARPGEEQQPWERAAKAAKAAQDVKRADRELALKVAYEKLSRQGPVKVGTLWKELQAANPTMDIKTEQTVRNWVDSCPFLERDKEGRTGLVWMVMETEDVPFDE